MKKRAILLYAAILFFVACNAEAPTSEQPQEKMAEGTIVNASVSDLQMQTDEAVEMNFQIENANIENVEDLIAGQKIQVYYTETAGNDTKTSLTATRIINPEVNHVEGNVVDATMNTLTIQQNGGDPLSFSTEDADKSAIDGLLLGDDIKVYYVGEVSGTNTASVVVLKLTRSGEKSVVGTVTDATMNTVALQLDNGTTLQFGTENADKSALLELLIGDRLTVVYTGTIYGTGTNNITVLRLSSPAMYSVEGEIVDAAMNSILIRTDDGQELHFGTEDIDWKPCSGLLYG